MTTFPIEREHTIIKTGGFELNIPNGAKSSIFCTANKNQHEPSLLKFMNKWVINQFYSSYTDELELLLLIGKV